MKLQKNSSNLDYVFIGSSNTYLHVNSKIFQSNGLNVYNYGVSGRAIIEYPYAVKKSVKLAPKNIVISVKIDELYQDELGKSLELNILEHNWNDLSEVSNINELYLYAKQTIKNFHSIIVYADAIYYRLRTLFYKFTPQTENNISIVEQTDNIPEQVQASQIIIKNNSLTKSKSANSTNDIINQKIETKNHNFKKKYSMALNSPDCNVIDIMYMKEYEHQVKCSNGDGIMYGSMIAQDNYKYAVNKTRKLKTISSKYIKYLNFMLDCIKDNKIDPILVLIADHGIDYDYDLSELKKQIHVFDIIEMNRYYIKDEFWYDEKHLNHIGRDLYTNKLLDNLENHNKQHNI